MVPEFISEIPVDPYDGKPLRYAVDSTGYRVYSVGTDLVDDGGIAGEYQLEPDAVFSVELPETP